MLALAIMATIGAMLWTLFISYANGMRSSPGEFQGIGLILAGWVIMAFFWIGWLAS